jgi:hypothetical protein
MFRRLDIAESWRRAKAQFATVVAERDTLRAELELIEQENILVREQLRELQTSNRELRALYLARHEASDEFAALHREAQIQRALAAEREPGELLH